MPLKFDCELVQAGAQELLGCGAAHLEFNQKLGDKVGILCRCGHTIESLAFKVKAPDTLPHSSVLV